LNCGTVQTVVFFVFHFIYLFVIYFLFQNVLKLPTKSSGGPIIAFQVDLRQVGGFLRVLRFPPPIKLTTMI
jgi:hypothetical protein